MTPEQISNLVYLYVNAPKMQEAIDSLETLDLDRTKLKKAFNATQKELNKMIKKLYTDIGEEEESQLRDLTTAYEQSIEHFKNEIKNG